MPGLRHEAVLEQMQLRLIKAPEMMRVRKRTVEYPSGRSKNGWVRRTSWRES